MNFINRAFKNVTRRPSKSILLTLTFFLIGNLVIIGLGVSSASESAKTLTRQKMRAVVTYAVDYNKVYQYVETLTDQDEIEDFYRNYPRVKVADVAEFLADPRVRMANSISNNMWYTDSENSVDFVHLNNSREQSMEENGGQTCYYDDTGAMICETYKEPVFFIKSNMYPGMIEFEDGDYRITSGRFYNQKEIDEAAFVCLISENLAQTNGLGVGDILHLATGFLNNYQKRSGITEEDLNADFEIIGIFAHNSPLTPDMSNYDYASPAIENVTLLLDDPLHVEDFVEDYQKSLSQFTSLDANNEEFKRLAKPLDTLSMYANFIVWLVVINAIVIISLVTALTLKTREYEIGVLLSIGASKLKVILQFFIELAIVAVLGFTLSVISGSLIAKRIGNTVLEAQIASSDVNEEEEIFTGNYLDPWNTDYTTEISLDDLISEYEVKISPLIIAEIFVLGLGIVMISVIIPSFMIMRYNPKKILMNTN